MLARFTSICIAALTCAFLVSSQGDPQLEGTWTTKSRKVLTGPGFYDPVNEKMFEPDLTGFSYSFTKDGFYESSYYRAVSNPTTPSCPQGVIQWQHGKYVKNANKSLSLFPIHVDGRQLQSDPCQYKSSIYTRWSQFELMKKYEVKIDEYSKAQRLNLYRFDGAPLSPMYLAYKPPQMLPTQTLNPTATSDGQAQPTRKSKRDLAAESDHFADEPLNEHVLIKRKDPINADKWWWIGVGMTGLGGVAYFMF